MSRENGHWYTITGEPCHFVPKKDGSGNRATTLADARKMNLLPSCTQVLKILDKPGLRDWLIRQAVMAVVTAPDVAGEDLDAKITRVLDTERQQDQESQMAMDRGTAIHAALEAAAANLPVDPELEPWITPAWMEIIRRGKVIGTEVIVVGEGYAGKVDLIQDGNEVWIWDWKTTKKLPNPDKGGAWSEHRLQLAAYAMAWANGDKRIRTGNVYISTVEQGKFCVCEHQDDWRITYAEAFRPLVSVWQWLNQYTPSV